MTKETRGGARENAGRKASPDSRYKIVAIRCNDAEKDAADYIGPERIRELILREYKRQTKDGKE